VLAAGLVLAAVYVPASIELRKPSDNGPRIIESPTQQTVYKTFIFNIDKLDKTQLNPLVFNVLDVLPLLDDR
jgi:hypothetical protein